MLKGPTAVTPNSRPGDNSDSDSDETPILEDTLKVELIFYYYYHRSKKIKIDK